MKFTERYFDHIAHALYADLMSKEEIATMLDGKDFWFSSDEVLDRLMKSGNREILGSESDALPIAGESTVEETPEVEEAPTKPRKAKVEITSRKKNH